MITTTQLAAKVHKCYFCHQDIEVRELYCKITVFPWDRVPDDVDEEGRTTYAPLGHFHHMLYHYRCYEPYV